MFEPAHGVGHGVIAGREADANEAFTVGPECGAGRDGKPGALTQRIIDRFRKLTSETGTPIYG